MRVASRFAVAWCGLLFILAAFIPKLAAFFALIPAPVVGAAMCTAMGIQIGAALEIITSSGIEQRSYYVVGLPVVLGTLIGFLPQNIVNELPQAFRVFLGNGLTFGILLVLFLEHVLMRRTRAGRQGRSRTSGAGAREERCPRCGEVVRLYRNPLLTVDIIIEVPERALF